MTWISLLASPLPHLNMKSLGETHYVKLAIICELLAQLRMRCCPKAQYDVGKLLMFLRQMFVVHLLDRLHNGRVLIVL